MAREGSMLREYLKNELQFTGNVSNLRNPKRYALEKGVGQPLANPNLFPVSGLRSPKTSEFC